VRETVERMKQLEMKKRDQEAKQQAAATAAANNPSTKVKASRRHTLAASNNNNNNNNNNIVKNPNGAEVTAAHPNKLSTSVSCAETVEDNTSQIGLSTNSADEWVLVPGKSTSLSHPALFETITIEETSSEMVDSGSTVANNAAAESSEVVDESSTLAQHIHQEPDGSSSRNDLLASIAQRKPMSRRKSSFM
jgi:hypothetical protein